MAVDEDARGRVATAAGFLRPWKPRRVDERPGKSSKCPKNVVQFYARHGYAMTGQAETLFGVIRHWRMEKVLQRTFDPGS